MKNLLLLFLLFPFLPLASQPWYSKTFDPFDGGFENIRDFKVKGDTMFMRGSSICDAPDKLCTVMGAYSLSAGSFLQLVKLEQVQSGPSLLFKDNVFYLSAEEKVYNQNIGFSTVTTDFEYMGTLDLNIQDDRYYSYVIRRAIEFGNRFIVGANVLDSLDKVQLAWGEIRDREKPVLFILDENLEADTILIISPAPGQSLKIEDMALGPDSVLYVSYFYREQNFIESKVVHGFDKDFQKVFNWQGPEISYKPRTSMAVGPDSTLYVSYSHGWLQYIMALRPDGSLKWQSALDTLGGGQGIYSISRLTIAANGDIIGAGSIQSAAYGLGVSGYMFRMAPDGQKKWDRVIRLNKNMDINPTIPEGFGFQCWFEAFAELPNGDLIAGGQVFQADHQPPPSPVYGYDVDMWLVRTDSTGCLWKDCPYIQEVVSKLNYIPIVTPANEWVVDYSFFTPGFPEEIRRYTFNQDSVLIGSHYYRELIYSIGESGGPWVGGNGFFRETDGEVYKLDAVGEEWLIYDFKMGIGDTLVPNDNFTQFGREIVEVGSIILTDGVPRKTATLACDECCTDPVTWVEGMGDLEHLFRTEFFCSFVDQDGIQLKIRCFSTDGQLLYLRDDLEGCYITSAKESTPPRKHFFVISPNPAKNYFNLTLLDALPFGEVMLEITDLSGRMIEAANIGAMNQTVSTENIPSGLYFVKLKYKQSILETQKLLISH